MSLELTLSLDATTVAPFRVALDSLRDDPGHGGLATLARAALLRHAALADTCLTPALSDRLMPVAAITQMLTDTAWTTSRDSRASLVAALRYFVEPADLIPDDEPTFGLLDDAIVLELALGDARHDWLAWQEFHAFRAEHGADMAMDRDSWMRARDAILRQQIRQSRRSTYAAPLSLAGHCGRVPSYLARDALSAFRVH